MSRAFHLAVISILVSLIRLILAKSSCYVDTWEAIQCVNKNALIFRAGKLCGQSVDVLWFDQICGSESATEFKFRCCNYKQSENVPNLNAIRKHFSSIIREVFQVKKEMDRLLDENLATADLFFSNLNFTKSGNRNVLDKNAYAVHLSQILLEPWKTVDRTIEKFVNSDFVQDRFQPEAIVTPGGKVLITSRHHTWEAYRNAMDLLGSEAVDNLLGVMVDIILEVPLEMELKDDFLDVPTLFDLKIEHPGLREAQDKAKEYWVETYLSQLWFIPKNDLGELLKQPNITDAVVEYYMEHLVDLLQADFQSSKTSSSGGSFWIYILMVGIGFILSAVAIKVRELIKTKTRRNSVSSGLVNVLYVNDRVLP
ncbi:hypothetical protein L596_020927 [Steinernema carpocapsae]|uniref:Uncharacterized protein n=1 Tax=Steinernema carpocapsae TaxID=34508 RepID=A0A4U5MUX6_STECR|nr:hypothetical protein L596_020924 [Steinernema carpocapsae]TKR73637.1 hypothetical protein L596_020927 [Steinernema carpocapsae]